MRSVLLALGLGLLPGIAAEAQTAGPFDGTWVGRGTLTANRGRGTDCGPETVNNRLTVQGGRLSILYSPQAGIRFEGPVAADGGFSIVSGQSRFAGRFTERGMAATFSHPSCERAWRFVRG
ncbi:MAG: hypothetical protein ACK4PG_14115 [Acetobacteraceae bacterium]